MNEPDSPGFLQRLLRGPTLNGWGFLVGLVGLGFAGYTYLESKVEPLLVARLNAVRTIVVSPEGVENLQVLADGRQIKGPITAVQVAVWNAGRRPIKGTEDVLEPIGLEMEGKAPIISARILRLSREVTRFEMDQSGKAEGLLGLRFRILEQGDGALLQITYMGNDKLPVIGRGVIVGQNKFEVTTPSEQKRLSEQPTPRWVRLLLFAGLFVVTAFAGYFFVASEPKAIPSAFRALRARPIEWGALLPLVLVAIFIVMIVLTVAEMIVASATLLPPFPFN